MVDGQAGLNLVAALNHVVLEIKNMLDHVTTPSLLMVVHHVQDQAQKQTCTHPVCKQEHTAVGGR